MNAAPELAREIRRRLTWIAILANGVGSAVVFMFVGFLIPLFLDADERARLGLLNGTVLVCYLVVSLPLGIAWAGRYTARVQRWLRTGRPADDAVRQVVLRTPLRALAASAAGWGGAAVLFALLNIGVSAGFALSVAMTVLMGGITTCTLVYLLSERALRPLTALALASGLPPRPVGPGVGGRLVMAWTLATAVPLLGILVVGGIGVSRNDVGPEEVSGAVIFLAAVALTVGLLAMLFAARSIADPVASVRAALARVERGDFGGQMPVDDGSEIGLLEAGFNRMAAGLGERERLRDLFGRHVGRDVARAALHGDVALGGEEREIAALFIDVVGSTSLAAERPPAEVVTLLNAFFAVVVQVTEAHGGLVNKFQGDAALCVFGAPVTRRDPAGDALAAARALRSRLLEEVPEINFGIGVSASRAVAGNVGAEQRFEYTVIGDPVNEAARLCELAKRRAEGVLASEATLVRAGRGEAVRWSLGEAVTLRGRPAETRLATVVDGLAPTEAAR